MNTKIKQIAISGGNGNMGMLLSDLIDQSKSFEISGIYDPVSNSQKYNNFATYSDIKADYLFEFSPADKINENINNQLNHKNKFSLIVGSSGLTHESLESLKKLSKHKLVIVIPNFSIGASYQKLISVLLSEEFSNKYIVEKHHLNKKDAPSGTSIDLAQSINTENNKINDNDTSNTFNIINNVQIESIRSDEYLAEQIVNMSNEHEIFNTEHIVKDRKAYLSGINLVLENLEKLNGFYFGLESIIKDRFKI